MAITDLISVCLILFLSLRGFTRGFLKSLIGPLALIICAGISALYLSWTKNILISLCIGLLGPMILTWFFKFFINSWKVATNSEGNLSLLSQIAGALLTLTWGMVIWLTSLYLVIFITPNKNPFDTIYGDTHRSNTYQLIKPFDFTATPVQKPTDNAPKNKTSNSQDELKTLSQDERIQNVINDPAITKAINNKDYAALMSNPKIMALIQDPQMLKKMMSLYKTMSEEGSLPKQ